MADRPAAAESSERAETVADGAAEADFPRTQSVMVAFMAAMIGLAGIVGLGFAMWGLRVAP